MKLRSMLFAAAATAAALLSTPASAATILLYNTGVDSTGTVKANGAAETNYVFSGGAARVVTSANGILINPGVWTGDNSLSAWIGPATDSLSFIAGGDYLYSTTFTLDGLDPLTAQISGRWSADNLGIDILLNGVSTGQNTGPPTPIISGPTSR